MEPAKVDDMLNAMKKAVEDLSTTYEADAMAYRSNPRPRTPLVERNAKKEPEIEAKPKVEKKVLMTENERRALKAGEKAAK